MLTRGGLPEPQLNWVLRTASGRFVARLDQLPLGRHPRLTATRCVLSVHSGSEQYVMGSTPYVLRSFRFDYEGEAEVASKARLDVGFRVGPGRVARRVTARAQIVSSA